jgi:hypothetical protein
MAKKLHIVQGVRNFFVLFIRTPQSNSVEMVAVCIAHRAFQTSQAQSAFDFTLLKFFAQMNLIQVYVLGRVAYHRMYRPHKVRIVHLCALLCIQTRFRWFFR